MMTELSETAAKKLKAIGRTESVESVDSVAAMFAKHGMPRFRPVVEAFVQFGGYVLPFEPEGRFKIYRAKQAIRARRGPTSVSDDPEAFRIPFGESETIQSFYRIDGNGKLYEGDRLIADSMAEWIEAWAARGS